MCQKIIAEIQIIFEGKDFFMKWCQESRTNFQQRLQILAGSYDKKKMPSQLEGIF
jgi:hypothetical protein